MNEVFVEVLDKLSLVQTDLKAPKGQYNSFGGYYYRSCEDILEAVKPLLKKYNCTLFITDDMVCVGDRNYIKATAAFTDLDSGTCVNNTGFAREDATKKGMDGSQITGAASSYARKYALNGLFLIDDNKDADTNEYQNQQNNGPEPELPTCPKCGKPIHGFTRPDGTKATPQEVFIKLGMCTECHKAQKT